MKLLEMWKGFVESLGTQGGWLALLATILLFMPMLWKHDSEGWKAVMFIPGTITGTSNVQPGSVDETR